MGEDCCGKKDMTITQQLTKFWMGLCGVVIYKAKGLELLVIDKWLRILSFECNYKTISRTSSNAKIKNI